MSATEVDTLLKIALVVLGAFLKTMLDAVSSFTNRWRKRRDFAEALTALLGQLEEARARRDWKSTSVRAHVERVLEYYRRYEPTSLHRTARVREELLELYGALRSFAALRFDPEVFVPRTEWFERAIPLRLSEFSDLVPMSRLDEAKRYFAETAALVEQGEYSALERLPGAAAILIKLATQCYAGVGRAEAITEVLARLHQLEELAPQRAFDELISRIKVATSFNTTRAA